ncbi:MAG: tetratricopeptide repeat protein [Prevotella sp.]
MAYYPEEYFNTEQFRRLLHDFEASEHGGEPLLPDSEEFVDLAEYYFNNGSEDYAMKLIERARDIYPDSSGPLLFLAREALISRKDVDAAEYYAEQITESGDPEYYFIKAEILIYRGQIRQADDILEEGLLYTDDSDESPDNYCMDVAAMYMDLSLDEQAQKWLERCSDHHDNEWLELHARLLNLKGEYEKCCSIYNSLLDKDPYSVTLWNCLAVIQAEHRDYDEAVNSCNFALAIDPNNLLALRNKAQIFEYEQNYKEALAIYEKLSLIDRTETNYWRIYTGFCHFMLEEYIEAINDFEAVADDVKADKDLMAGNYLRWAYSLIKTGKTGESFAFMDKAEKYGAAIDEVNIIKGEANLCLGDLRSATVCYMTAIKKSDNMGLTTTIAATCLLKHGYAEVAYDMLDHLYKIFPDCNYGFACMAKCSYILGKTSDFVDYLEKSIRNSPEETKDLMGHLFPTDMKPEKYMDYLRSILDIF